MTSGQNQQIKKLVAIGQFILINVAACFFIIKFLNLVHSLGINDAWFIPDSFRWENGRLRRNLNQWRIASVIILVIEWLLLNILLYRINRWVNRYYFQSTNLTIALLSTATVAIITGIRLATTLITYLLSSMSK